MTGESSLLSAGVFCGCRLRSNEVRRSWSRRSIMAELDVPPPPALLPPVLLPPAAPQLSSPPTGSRRPPLALFICFSASSFLNDPLVVCAPTSPPVRAPRRRSGGARRERGERERANRASSRGLPRHRLGATSLGDGLGGLGATSLWCAPRRVELPLAD